MDELKQRIVERILSQVDPTALMQQVTGRDLGRRQAQIALVQELVSVFATSLAQEGAHLGPLERDDLLKQVIAEVMSYGPRREALRGLAVRPSAERLARRGTWDESVVAYLRACIEAGRSVLVSGEPGAGKTTLLSVIATLAPDARLVSVEAVASLDIDHPHLVRLQGAGADLFETALHLAPDWLLVDELTPETALRALQAMAAVPVLGTISASSAQSALGRFVDWVLDVTPGLSEELAARLIADNVDVIVSVARLYEGAHRVSEIIEVVPDPQREVGLKVTTLVARDKAGNLAATGVESAFVTGGILRSLPRLEAGIETGAPPLPEIEALPLPSEPERKGFLDRLFSRRRPKGPTLETAVSAAARGAAIAATTSATDYSTVGAPPVVQRMTTYLAGDDLFDMSYAIEEGEEFLGETGIGIAEVLEEGTPKRVLGFEVWMFDKVTLETPSGAILSQSAYDDEGLRGKYAARGPVVVGMPGQRITLDTGPLRLEVQVKDAASDEAGAFERLTIELAAWPGEGAS